MNCKDIEYPLRLCVEMLNYCVFLNEKTQHAYPSEIQEKLSFFFTEKQIKDSLDILSGLNKGDK